MKEYVEREAVADVINGYNKVNYVEARTESLLHDVNDIPAADVVPWEWLDRYASEMRMNFASDFVADARKRYEEGIH